MIQHIFSDMDGTLLNAEGELETKNIERIMESGIPFTLVSARAPMEMDFAIDALKLEDVQIAFNGGVIFKPSKSGREIISESVLELPVAEKIFRLLKTHFPSVSASFYDLNAWYAEKMDQGILFEQKIAGQTPILLAADDFFSEETNKVFKIMLIVFEEEQMLALIDFFEELALEGVSVQRSAQYHLEITSHEAKKSKGIQFVMAREQLEKEQVAAFGDGHNDIPMLEMVGHPIVMANASEEIKQLGKYITKSNEEDGVAYGIENYILTRKRRREEL